MFPEKPLDKPVGMTVADSKIRVPIRLQEKDLFRADLTQNGVDHSGRIALFRCAAAGNSVVHRRGIGYPVQKQDLISAETQKIHNGRVRLRRAQVPRDASIQEALILQDTEKQTFGQTGVVLPFATGRLRLPLQSELLQGLQRSPPCR